MIDHRLPRYSIGKDEMAYAFGLPAAKLAAKTLWEDGATGRNRPPLWVYNAKGEPVGYYAGGSWSSFKFTGWSDRGAHFVVVTGMLRIEAARQLVAAKRGRKG